MDTFIIADDGPSHLTMIELEASTKADEISLYHASTNSLDAYHGPSSQDNKSASLLPVQLTSDYLYRVANKFSALALSAASGMCQVDIWSAHVPAHGGGGGEDSSRHERGSRNIKFHSLTFATAYRWLVSRWPKFVFAINAYCSCKLTVNIFHQYKHDFSVIKLRSLSGRGRDAVPVHLAPTDQTHQIQPQYLFHLETMINSSRHTLKNRIGAPHIGGTITIELVYITFVMFSLVAYLTSMFYFNRVAKFDFHLLRAIADRERERGHGKRLIAGVLKEFIESSRNYANICMEQYQNLSSIERVMMIEHRRAQVVNDGDDAIIEFECRCNTSGAGGGGGGEVARSKQQQQQRTADKALREHALDHKLLVRQLKLMMAREEFEPLNRTSAWLNRMSLLFFISFYGSLTWGTISNITMCYVIPRAAHFETELITPLDYLINLDLFLMSIIITIALCFYLSTSVVSCIDQAILIAQVNRLIQDCRVNNTQLYYKDCAWRRFHRGSRAGLALALSHDHDDGMTPASSSRATPPPLPRISDSTNHNYAAQTHEIGSLMSGGESTRLLLSNGSCSCATKRSTIDQRKPEIMVISEIARTGWGPTTNDRKLKSKICHSKMNANLLTAFMHYKIFVVQLRPILRPVGFVTFASVVTMIVHLILVRLHTPYVEHAQLKQSYYILSLITLLFINFNFIPVCLVNCRCVRLYKTLNSLLAHTVEIELHEKELNSRWASAPVACGYDEPLERWCWWWSDGHHDSRHKLPAPASKLIKPSHERIYDQYTLWMLRRELEWSLRFVKQFEIRSMGFTFNYATVLKIYTYLGAIFLSIMYDSHPTNLGSDTFSSFRHFLEDPFGVLTE